MSFIVSAFLSRLPEVVRRMQKSAVCLGKLEGEDSKYTSRFFEAQWSRQREVQQNVISANTQKLKARMGILMDLEEELLEAR